MESAVLRYCTPKDGAVLQRTCVPQGVTDLKVAAYAIRGGVGLACYCDTELCNAAPPMTGHLTVIFIGVVSLLALTTGHLLSQ